GTHSSSIVPSSGNGHSYHPEARQPKGALPWAASSSPPGSGNGRGNGEFRSGCLSSGGDGTGAKEQLTAAGNPEQESVTTLETEPEIGVTVIFEPVELPGLSCKADGEASSKMEAEAPAQLGL